MFAIAMTLLAFKVEAPRDVMTAADLAPVVPQALAFLLSFAVVANFWWHHHRLLARLDAIDPGLIALNLPLLGAVALVPFPTELIGRHPGTVPAAAAYVSLMLLITAFTLLIVWRAERAHLWAADVTGRERRQQTTGWAVSLAMTLLALLVALRLPLAGLLMLLLTGPADAFVRRFLVIGD